MVSLGGKSYQVCICISGEKKTTSSTRLHVSLFFWKANCVKALWHRNSFHIKPALEEMFDCQSRRLVGGEVPQCPSLFRVFTVDSQESVEWAVGTQHCDGSTGDNKKQTVLLVMWPKPKVSCVFLKHTCCHIAVAAYTAWVHWQVFINGHDSGRATCFCFGLYRNPHLLQCHISGS